jgi:hypothetical protein
VKRNGPPQACTNSQDDGRIKWTSVRPWPKMIS